MRCAKALFSSGCASRPAPFAPTKSNWGSNEATNWLKFGITEGIVTLSDLMQSLLDDMMPLSNDPAESLAVRRQDGSWRSTR